MLSIERRHVEETASMRRRLARVEALEITPLTTLDARFFNANGDTLTGNLVIEIEADNSSPLYFTLWDPSGAVGGVPFIFRAARGTKASPTAIQSGDILGGFGMRGYGATAFSGGARAAIYGIADENWTDSAQGAHIDFRTSAVGAASLVERLRITPGGDLGIATSSPGGRVHINGTADDEQLIVEAHSTQNANVQEWRNSSGTVFSRVNGACQIIARLDVIAKSAAYTATVDDQVILCTAGAGGWALTLPAVSPSGQQFHIKKVDSGAGAITVTRAGSATIDGGTTYSLAAQYDAIHIASDGTNWHVIGKVP